MCVCAGGVGGAESQASSARTPGNSLQGRRGWRGTRPLPGASSAACSRSGGRRLALPPPEPRSCLPPGREMSTRPGRQAALSRPARQRTAPGGSREGEPGPVDRTSLGGVPPGGGQQQASHGHGEPPGWAGLEPSGRTRPGGQGAAPRERAGGGGAPPRGPYFLCAFGRPILDFR